MVLAENGNGAVDKRFWVSIGGLLLAILGTWMALSDKVTSNTVNIRRNQDALQDLNANVTRRCDKIEATVNTILMELRK